MREGGATDDQGTMREGGATPAVPSGDGSVTGPGAGMFKQASIRRWTENSSQQRLDIAWGMHLYEHGAPFNYVTGEKTHELHDLYLELGEKRQRVKMPSRMLMATVVLDIGYEQTQEAMKPLMECWDINGCTLITDGCTDRTFRPVVGKPGEGALLFAEVRGYSAFHFTVPASEVLNDQQGSRFQAAHCLWPPDTVMNFIAAGESGAVMLKVVDMSKRKKNAVSLAKLWEGVIREIGVHRVNALCTDNAEVNKHAARILRRRTDVNISRIPWVLCAAHCLNLLLKGICEESWVREPHKRGKTIVKCIKNHHKTTQLFKDCSKMERSRTLTMPTEVRFASVYMMLERLLDRKKVLKAMMKEGWLDIKWAARKKCEIAETVYLTVRSEEWWEEVEAAVDMMTPVYDLLRQMDKSGTAPYYDTDNSDDGEDLVWRGKGKKRKDMECLDGACHGKGKAQVEEDDDGDSHEEDEVDEIVTAEFALRTPSESDEDSDDDPSEDDMALRQDASQMDSDLEFLLPRTCDSPNATQTEDEAARAYA
ncbi:hypothetical protein CBR_g54825 [Chara braunii]|uniref:DUF659 domain-containing protein n=1 Tax=Chara braunii TaxID=69332 RepID=A0A388JPT3_CHABU|nr:hypothetical protein CBR_g54825 [Chara braunii]|eukprot:GBG59722.1 hypothetical protein CBR_g54825 [Chara braunii]